MFHTLFCVVLAVHVHISVLLVGVVPGVVALGVNCRADVEYWETIALLTNYVNGRLDLNTSIGFQHICGCAEGAAAMFVRSEKQVANVVFHVVWRACFAFVFGLVLVDLLVELGHLLMVTVLIPMIVALL